MLVIKSVKNSTFYRKSARRLRGCKRTMKKAYFGEEEYEDSDPEQTKKDLEDSEADKNKIENNVIQNDKD